MVMLRFLMTVHVCVVTIVSFSVLLVSGLRTIEGLLRVFPMSIILVVPCLFHHHVVYTHRIYSLFDI